MPDLQRPPEKYWDALAKLYPQELISDYRTRIEKPGPFYQKEPLDPCAVSLLNRLVHDGHLKAERFFACPNCTVPIEPVDGEPLASCSCGLDFEHEEPIETAAYYRDGLPSRDPSWLITVHGMNTHGPWQEIFSWKFAQQYGYAIPIATYKYGRRLITPVFRFLQEREARKLAAKIKELTNEGPERFSERKPDAIAHSFGTWIIVRALELEPRLRLGRLILTGSVVPPNYDWKPLLEGDSPQIEAVLCHFGGRDCVVPLAQFLVPGAGPSGRVGLNKNSQTDQVRQLYAPSFSHSDYFDKHLISNSIEEAWCPFLTCPAERLSMHANATGASEWQPSALRMVTHCLKVPLLVALLLFVLALPLVVPVGIATIASGAKYFWANACQRDEKH